jgi:hypothetical protein
VNLKEQVLGFALSACASRNSQGITFSLFVTLEMDREVPSSTSVEDAMTTSKN